MNQVGIEIDLIHGKVFLNNFRVLHPLTWILIHLSHLAGVASTEIRPALVVVVVATKKL